MNLSERRYWRATEWVETLPTSWAPVPAGRLFTERRTLGNSSETLLSVTQRHGVVRREDLDSRVWNPESEAPETYKLVEPGDFVISLRAFEGGIELSRHRGLVSPAYIVLRPRIEFDPGFMRWVLKARPIITALQSVTTGIRQGKSISFQAFRQLPIPLPAIGEQLAIVRFLDEETSKIDALINAKTLLIERLRERAHQLLVSAVSGESMSGSHKRSDNAWITEVPSDWRIWKVGHAFRTIGSGTTPSADEITFYDGDVPWVTTSELRENVIHETNKRVSTSALTKYSALKLFPAGSLVIAMYGATIGRLGFLGIEACTNQACCVLHGSSVLDMRFVYYWLLACRRDIIRRAEGAGQPNIGQDTIRNLRIAAPHLETQREIAAQLDSSLAGSEELVSHVKGAIGLLDEYRSALITAAVTGQVDVGSAA